MAGTCDRLGEGHNTHRKKGNKKTKSKLHNNKNHILNYINWWSDNFETKMDFWLRVKSIRNTAMILVNI